MHESGKNGENVQRHWSNMASESKSEASDTVKCTGQLASKDVNGTLVPSLHL